MAPFNISTIRETFPALHQQVYNRPLVYFDNAATTQKPAVVIDALRTYYEKQNSNIHRGVHYLSQQATEAFEHARRLVQRFIHAEKPEEIIFTRGTTESINLVASTFGKRFLKPGAEVLISEMEHHSNIVPWQMACADYGAVLKVIPVTDSGELDMEKFGSLLNERTGIIAITHISNTLGTINPIKQIIERAHAKGIPVLIDGAQAVPHVTTDVQELDCDFYCFSGHKMYAPMGVGVLYGKEEMLKKLPPYQGGGEMIKEVRFEGTSYNDLPYKFEAGTPNVGDVIGLGKAIEWLEETGLSHIACHEQDLLQYATTRLQEVDGIKIYGTAEHKTAVISFLIGNIHPYDAGVILDKFGIALRTGHHCTQPLIERFGIPGTIRASFAVYNTREEIDAMMEGILRVKEMFG
jgi:cysteine desulfurase / selenocysteine lyase